LEGAIPRHSPVSTPEPSIVLEADVLEAEAGFWKRVAADPLASVLQHANQRVSLSERRLAYVIAVQDAVLGNPAYLPYTTKTGRGRSFCNIAFSDQAKRLGVAGASILGIRSANAQVRRLKDRVARGRGWVTLTDKPFIQELANHGVFVGAGRIETILDKCGELHGHVVMARCGPESWVRDPDAPFINNVGTRNWVVPHERSHRDFTWFTPNWDPTARIAMAEAAVQHCAGFVGEKSRAVQWIAGLLAATAAETSVQPGAAGSDCARVAQHYAAGFLRDLTKSTQTLQPNWIIETCTRIAANR